ncbi:MAG TPA: SCO family protein [Acidimicrobiales bacterium]|nr:SCO family protein [Acidimicrobiales bacterium]
MGDVEDVRGVTAGDAGAVGPVGTGPAQGADRPPTDAAPPTPPEARGRKGPGTALFVALGVLVLLAGGFALVAARHHSQPSQAIRVSGIPSSVSTPLAALMALAPVPTKPAPDFTLVDQSGHTMSLSDFRGSAVVLSFMDTHCTDICPIVSQEFVDAYHDLGPAASRTVFVAVNVNQYHAAVADVATFSHAHQLDTIPNWHFFTGSTTDLQAVWANYGIAVQAPNPNADIIHSSVTYFIDPAGNERYLADPSVDHTASGASFLPAGQLTSWGRGISLVSRSLLG